MSNLKIYFEDKSFFTLKYIDEKKEKAFLDSIVDIRQMQMLYLSAITAFFYVLYIGIDFFILEEEKFYLASFFHFIVISLLFLSIILILKKKYTAFVKPILYISVIFAAITTIFLANIGTTYYLIDVYPMILWVFVLIGFLFIEAVIINCIIITLHIAFFLFYSTIEFEESLIHIFILSATFFMGLIGGYIIEFYSRVNFESKEKILEMQNELKKQANIDYLTGLYNRRYFDNISKNFLRLVKREKEQMSLILLDIDRFKDINDTYGHFIGDNVIKNLATLLKNSTRESDVISRFGGEEFAILLPHTNKNGASTIAESIRQKVESLNIEINDGKIVSFTISLGVESINSYENNAVYEALNRADIALYTAKKSGRNQTVVYNTRKKQLN